MVPRGEIGGAEEGIVLWDLILWAAPLNELGYSS